MVAEYVSCTKLLQNIIAPCSWLKGKCTVTILNKSMYCHWKIHADTGPKLLKPYFQRLSLPLSALLSQPCDLPELPVLTRTLENCKDNIKADGQGVPSARSSFGDASGRTPGAEAHCHQKTGLSAPLCSDFLRAWGQCLLMHHLASSLSLALWEGRLMFAFREAEGVSGTSLKAERSS